MKKSGILLTLPLYLLVSLYSLADFHGDAPNGKPQNCLLCLFSNTPVNPTQAFAWIDIPPALTSTPEHHLPMQLEQSRESITLHELDAAQQFLFSLPPNRAPPQSS